jgi:hypothetical protein
MVLAALPASVRAAPVSFAALHSTAPHFRSITPRSLLNFCFKAWPISQAQKPNTQMGTSLLQASNTAHWVPFRSVRSLFHFSPAQSTRCQLFCSPAVPTSAAFSLRMLIAHVVPPFRKASLSFACIVRPPPYASRNILRRPPMELASASFVGLYCQPLVGARWHVRSFLPPVPYGGSPPALQPRQVCVARPTLLLAAGALPCFV